MELGAAVIGLAVLARLAHRLGFSAIPLYLLGGLAFGNGGLLPLRFSEDFIHVGVALSGPLVQEAQRLLGPLRDLFAALFFLFFGLQIDPATLPPVLWQAVALGVVTAGTKVVTGWWAARRAGVDTPGGLRAGATLVARGEFSIVIAGLGVGAGLEPELGPLAAAYVLLLAVLGPMLARWIGPRDGARPGEGERPGGGGDG
jgi:CPA2 family monovalent cation:H+ antiporter-2